MKSKLKLSHLYHGKDGFDLDLFAIDRIFYNEDGEVDWAERIFRIKTPNFILRFLFGCEL